MINDFSELIEYLDEKFLSINENFSGINAKFKSIDERFESLEQKVSQLPTRSYLDDRMSILEGGLAVKLRKEDNKVNRLTEILQNKKILTDKDVSELKNLQVFSN